MANPYELGEIRKWEASAVIEFSCKNCGQKLSVEDRHSGKQVKCYPAFSEWDRIVLKKGVMTLRNILIASVLLSMFSERPAIAQVGPTAPQAATSATETTVEPAQPETREDIERKIEELKAQLDSPIVRTRDLALAKLSLLGPSAIPALISALGHTSPQVRLSAAGYLGASPSYADVGK